MNKILISKCLLGYKCRFDGQIKSYPGLDKLKKKYTIVPVCPEMEAGLPCPRDRHEIKNGTGADVLDNRTTVINENGDDRTREFILAAQKTLEVAKANEIKIAVLKSKSPSCSTEFVYDGFFSGRLIEGRGVAAELLYRNGVTLFDENNFEELID